MIKKVKKPLEKLKAIREKNNYTYQDMADKLDICKAYYWQLENGNRNLYYDLAKRIAKIFDLKPDDLFFED
ncbi:MAG: helix-turn-helix transcriptional regulator [Bacilli bacterium]|nr:helix-turn-helix transcriptional regulator [Bacilli bacterium]